MPNNPYTGNKRHEEDILRNLKYRQQNGGDSSSVRQQIHSAEKLLEKYKRQEHDWNQKHR